MADLLHQEFSSRQTIIVQKYPILTESHYSQFGFKSKASTLHAEFIVNGTIKHYNNKGSPVSGADLGFLTP